MLTLNANGTFSYLPGAAFDFLALGESTIDNFFYELSDGLLTDTATVSVTVNGENDAPIAQDDLITTDEDTATVEDAFADNGFGPDSDPDTTDSFAVSAVEGSGANVGNPIILGSGAQVTVAANGVLTYSPNGAYESLAVGESSLDTFTYSIFDGLLTDTATVSATITGVNDTPIARDDLLSTDEDSILTGENVIASNGFGADTDPDTSDIPFLTVSDVNATGMVGTQIALPSGALVTVAANGDLTYDPNGQFEGLDDGESQTDTFQYTLTDPSGLTDTATVSLNIAGVNDRPVARDDRVTTDEDTALNGENVLNDNGFGADSDVDVETLTVAAVNGNPGDVGSQITLPGRMALLTLDANGVLSYDPNGQFEDLGRNESELDTFTYDVTDGDLTDQATVSVTVTGVNDGPAAQDDAFSTLEDVVFTGGNVLGDNGFGADSDPDTNDTPTVSDVTGGTVGSAFSLPSGAVLTIDANGNVTYDPNGVFNSLAVGETDTDSFDYTLSDGLITDTATVTMTIHGQNDAPIAEDDLFSTDEDTVLLGENVITNTNPNGADSDPDTSDIPGLAVSEVNGNGANVGNQFALGSGALVTLARRTSRPPSWPVIPIPIPATMRISPSPPLIRRVPWDWPFSAMGR